jgi:hypothetical protein
MDSTESIALLIVAITALFYIYAMIRRKKKSSCCKTGCDLKKNKE